MTTAIDLIDPSTIPHIDEHDRCFGSLETASGHLPLRALDVRAKISGTVAETTLEQTFVNTFEHPIEATYIFPLPPRAAVSHFELHVAGRVVTGQLKERGAARREYQQAIEQGHRAAIAEQERGDVFNIRVGNLPPGEDARVKLVMTAPLDVLDGEATFRFPLVIAPRYIPGVPLPGPQVGAGISPDTDAVPDASRISPPVLLPNYPNPVALSIELDVDAAGLGLGSIASSLHAVTTERSKDRAHIRLAPGERVDRDFILRFGLAHGAISTGCAASPATSGKPGVFQLTLMPPRNLPEQHRPRDVVFVLDRSGSMQGWKMVAARRALGRMVDTLNDRDRFHVYAFDTTIEAMPGHQLDDLIPATNKLRYRAIEYLAKIDARGGTEMADPLLRAARALNKGSTAGRDRWIVLVTDGQVGNEDQILKHLSSELHGARVFSVGIDRAVNESFLRRLGSIGDGGCELIESEDRLDDVMDRVHQAIDTPLLTELTIDAEGIELLDEGVLPSRIAGLFAGAPLIVSGRFHGDITDNARVIIRGANALGDNWSASVPIRAQQSEAIQSIWAKARLTELEDRYAIGRGQQHAIEKEMLRVSLEYNVLCKFTSFVAVDREEKIEHASPLQQVTQPAEMPSGWGPGSMPKPANNMPSPVARSAMPAPQMMQPTRSEGRGGAFSGMKKKSRARRAVSDAKPAPQALSAAAPPPGAPAPMSPPAPATFGASFSISDEMDEELDDFAGFEGNMAEPEEAFARQELSRSDAPAMIQGKSLAGATTQTRSGVVKGRIADMNPEKIRAVPMSTKSNVFDVAMILYTSITNLSPFAGESDFQTLNNIMTAALPADFWQQRAPDHHAGELEALLRSAFAAEESSRPSLADLASELDALIAQTPDRGRASLAKHFSRAAALRSSEPSTVAPPELRDGALELIEFIHTDHHTVLWKGVDTRTSTSFMAQVAYGPLAQDPALADLLRAPIIPGTQGTPAFQGLHETVDGDPCLVWDWVDGLTARALRAPTAGLETAAALELARQLCEIISRAHDAGIVHADLTAENILVDANGIAHVINFGFGAQRVAPPITSSPTPPTQPEQTSKSLLDKVRGMFWK